MTCIRYQDFHTECCLLAALQVPGMTESAISSDDLFWMEKPPGKTLVTNDKYTYMQSILGHQNYSYDR